MAVLFSVKTIATLRTNEAGIQGVVDTLLGRDQQILFSDYPFGDGGPEIIALLGELGSGKTTLVKALFKTWGFTEIVNSPTFGLVNEYRLPNFKGKLYHHDWYRINEAGELYDAGIEDILHEYPSKQVIEWPEIGDFLLRDLAENYKAKVMWVHIKHIQDMREYTLSFRSNESC